MKRIMLAALTVATMATPAFAMSDAACKAEWEKADANRDGVLAGEEARPYLSHMKSAPADGRITPALFMSSCQADTFKTSGATGTTVAPPRASTATSPTTTQTATVDPGAPLPGAKIGRAHV